MEFNAYKSKILTKAKQTSSKKNSNPINTVNAYLASFRNVLAKVPTKVLAIITVFLISTFIITYLYGQKLVTNEQARFAESDKGCSSAADCSCPAGQYALCIANSCVCRPASTPTPKPQSSNHNCPPGTHYSVPNGFCVPNSYTPTPTPTQNPTSNPGLIAYPNDEECAGNKTGNSCSFSSGGKTYYGTCYNGACYNDYYTIKINTNDETTAQQRCKEQGGTAAVQLSDGSYICVGCHNIPIAQDPNLSCKPPQCTGAKACVDPGTTSPGTDCLWYICDPNGSGTWIQTGTKCTEPAPTATSTSTSTQETSTTNDTTPTPTPTPQPGELTIAHAVAGSCTDLGYTADYTITINYNNDPENTLADITFTLTNALDADIDPSWVSDVNNAGSVDSTQKKITWPSATISEGEQLKYTYRINYPTSVLNSTFENTATISYQDSQKQASVTTNTACAESQQTTTTPTPTSTTTAPDTGIFDNIALPIGALSAIIMGLIIGL